MSSRGQIQTFLRNHSVSLILALCWAAGAVFAVLRGGWVLTAAQWLWHRAEWLVTWFGVGSVGPTIPIPPRISAYSTIDLVCAWAVFLIGCTGLIDLVRLRTEPRTDVTLTLSRAWVRRHRRLFVQNNAVTWLYCLALGPGVLVAKVWFT